MANWPSSLSSNTNLYVAVNSTRTTLAGAINNAVTTITLASTTGLPAVGAVTIDTEVVFYTSIAGAQLLGCIRGADGTTAASHSSGVQVAATVVAVHHNSIKDEIIALETDLHTRIGYGSSALTLGVDLGMNGHKMTGVSSSGSLSAPDIAGSTHPNNGISFEVGGNCVSIITGGIEALRVNGGQNTIVSDGGGTPAVDLVGGLGFKGDNGTGCGLPLVDNFGVIAGASWAAVFSKVTQTDAAYRDTFTMYNGAGGAANFGCYEKFKNGTTIGVSTSATKIMTLDEYSVIAFVSGNDGTNYFFDIVICGYSQTTPAVLFQNTVTGAPTARTYTNASLTDLKLTMASGTYAINVCSLQVHSR